MQLDSRFEVARAQMAPPSSEGRFEKKSISDGKFVTFEAVFSRPILGLGTLCKVKRKKSTENKK